MSSLAFGLLSLSHTSTSVMYFHHCRQTGFSDFIEQCFIINLEISKDILNSREGISNNY